jgi:hypothetical protein
MSLGQALKGFAMRFDIKRLAAAGLAALLTAPAAAQTTAAPASPDVRAAPMALEGTITITARAAAVGVGYSWGEGRLHFHGRTYFFSIRGISVADVGYARIVGHGRVFNLHRLADFSGTYAAVTGEATLGDGVGGQYLRNAAGVVIHINQTTRGVRLEGSADGVELKVRP